MAIASGRSGSFWIRISLTVVVTAVVALMLPSLALSVRVIVGSNAACPSSKVISTLWNTFRQAEIAEQLTKASRLLSRDPEGYELWETPRGRFWIPQRSMASYYLFQMLAEEDRQVYGCGDYGVRPGDIALDCGANVGAYTRDALNRGARLVVAIEPAPDNLECLKRNFREEIEDGRVIVYGKGVWDRDAELELSSNEWSSGGYRFLQPGTPRGKGPVLALTTIDKLVEELRLERVHLIKMDIEGAEKKALAGAVNTLVTQRPKLVIATEHAADDTEKIPALIQTLSAGYQVECGACALFNGLVRREAMYFR